MLKGHAHDCAHDRQRGVRPRKLTKMYKLFQVLCNGKLNKIVPKLYYLPPYSTVQVKSNLTFLSYFYPTSIPHHLQPRLEMGRVHTKLRLPFR